MWCPPYGVPPYIVPHRDVIPKVPRDFPYQPEPKGWALNLAWESSDPAYGLKFPYAEGRWIKTAMSGIRPCTREKIKNDRYTKRGTVKLRCDASGHETIMHKCVTAQEDPTRSTAVGNMRVSWPIPPPARR